MNLRNRVISIISQETSTFAFHFAKDAVSLVEILLNCFLIFFSPFFPFLYFAGLSLKDLNGVIYIGYKYLIHHQFLFCR